MSSAQLQARFSRIHKHYMQRQAQIIAQPGEWFGDAYSWEHEAGVCLTPIERALWADIRAEALVLYPQYPVGKFFVDFGHPAHKVAIECDGARWHTDIERDAARQAQIEALGWSVYRINGKDCFSDTQEIEREGGGISVKLGAARLFIRGIAERHPGLRRGQA